MFLPSQFIRVCSSDYVMKMNTNSGNHKQGVKKVLKVGFLHRMADY